ncbi:kielin/chordin-like protein [Penaeus japonicus]|uniref:kielin/chordin-like protein n=1 Tax=Penaeus japonicus TaxID=27405 RepID=UPI001C7135E0|nr:kielin/chordin-like protein [Penaeus japonicus]
MKVLCLLLLAGVALVESSALLGVQRNVALPPHFTCAPGSRWKVDCNTCTCSDTGVAACTLMACIGDVQQKSDEPVCDEGSRWKIDECNWCKCIRGAPACSSRSCDNSPPLIRTDGDDIDDIPPGGVCKPGSAWKPDCNWCSCTSDGMGSICTLKLCLSSFVPDPREKQCENGSKWKDDCNTCVCVNEKARCTQMACGTSRNTDNLPPDVVCTPGSAWKEECNWCRCADSGRAAGCTLMGCVNFREDPDEQMCTNGSKWKRDECNWCECVDGKFSCTERVCGHPAIDARQSVDKKETCTEGSRWRVSCNWCSCRNGTGGCTKKGCPPDFDELTDQPECEGNSRWLKDCNWCNCNNGRGICTTRACIERPTFHAAPTFEVTQEGVECTEGSHWRQSCNWCHCAEGKGACTKKMCIPGSEPSPDEPVCEGNSRWKQDCNWCNCVNGKGICTAKACGVQRPQAPEVTVVREDEATCTEGSRWRLGCNWCRCIEGRGACTKRGCIGEGPSPDEPVCEGTSSWKVDCNWCNCVNGRAICTEMACGSEGRSFDSSNIHESPVPKPCVNGTTWSKDCNKCSCVNGVGRCTRRLCRHAPVDPICNEPAIHPDVESCGGFESLWTFDSADGRCVEIVYGGCGGTENLFETKSDCEAKCTASRASQGSRRTLAGRQQDKCQLELNSGPCFGLFYRYGYNSANGRCEQFVFGGCAGNANNFETPQECQQQCGGGAPVMDTTCDRTKCPWKRWAHYLIKGCVPQYDNVACCPTSFSCPASDAVIPDPTKCYYRGVFYEDGEEVPVDDVCSASCHCIARSTPAQINCANIECPSLFRPPRPGCRLLYSPDQCCSTDEECQDPTTPPDLQTRAVGCSWGNKTYQIGDKMYFNDLPCQSCVCTSEFTSPTGPGCSKIDCGFEFRYTSRIAEGCVPIFFEEKCCPIDWMCPGDSRITPPVVQQQQQRVSAQKEEDQCHLGELAVSRGSKLNIDNCRLECRCITPPEITCVQYRSCELAEESTQPKDCPEVNCPVACQIMTDAVTGCPSCSCTNYTFSCDKKECPSGCRTDFDSKTGCLSCKCQCPKLPSGRPPCPMDCAVRYVTDEATGCEVCECDPTNPGHPFGPFDRSLCPTYPLGRLPCPQDCAIRIVLDDTGCEKCECDPTNPGHPFGPLQRSDCPKDYTGRAPCPMDCAIHYVTDPETGCERCECDPANPGHPFGPHIPPPRLDCPVGPSGRPPCPMDCAIRYVTDPDSGCEKCECDPAHPGHPFGPHHPPPRSNCPVGPSGRPPCPMDCAIRHVTDPETGCEICECDPTKPGHPFGPHGVDFQHTQCPRDHSGKPPCPMDCAVHIVMDEETGCEVCECDPDKPGNPFGPY